jgi:hypothetical protein
MKGWRVLIAFLKHFPLLQVFPAPEQSQLAFFKYPQGGL